MTNSVDLQRLKRLTKRLISDGYASTQKELASFLGYTESGLSQILTGKVPVSRPFINKLYEIEPRINKEWLLTGEGDMINNGSISQTVSGNKNNIAGMGSVNTGVPATLHEKALNEIAEQRKLAERSQTQIDRLLDIIENMQKTNK